MPCQEVIGSKLYRRFKLYKQILNKLKPIARPTEEDYEENEFMQSM